MRRGQRISASPGLGPLAEALRREQKTKIENIPHQVFFVKIVGWFLWFHGEVFHIHNETAQLSCVKNRAGLHPSMRFVALPTNISVSEIHKKSQNANPSIEEATQKNTRQNKINENLSSVLHSNLTLMIDLIPSSVMARLQSSMDPKAGVPWQL